MKYYVTDDKIKITEFDYLMKLASGYRVVLTTVDVTIISNQDWHEISPWQSNMMDEICYA
jgi:hypothetical protein|tara:strand:+ start:935 stop:1114 length:180 start_codon:yes stop_codon:yes gene_type:complete